MNICSSDWGSGFDSDSKYEWNVEDSAKSKLEYDLAHGRYVGGNGDRRGTGYIASIVFLGVLIGGVSLLTSVNVPTIIAVFISPGILALIGLGFVGLSKKL